MALLGAQLVITLIMVSIIQKVGPHCSLARWLLCSTGLIRYLYPTDDELRSMAGVPKSKLSKKDKRGLDNGYIEKQTFHVPKSLDLQLESARVVREDVIHLRYYTDFQWLVDFSLYALMVYIVSEVYMSFFPIKDEINLSMIWCFLMVLFSFKILFQLSMQYFKSSESVGERSMVIVSWFSYLLVAMIILLVDESNLETGLEPAYTSFNSGANAFLKRHGLPSQGPASKLILKFCIAVWAATVGALFTFPGLRTARMHWDSLKYCKERKFYCFFLNISFTAPFVLLLLWLRPVSKHYLTGRVFTGMTRPLMTEDTFESFRLIAVIVLVLQRFFFIPTYLQAYLNLADSRIQEQKKEAGRITNVDLQKKVAAVFYYMCVVALQYVTPLLMCLFLTFMYKTLGEYQWGPSTRDLLTGECGLNDAPVVTVYETLQDQAPDLALTIESLKQVLTVDVYRGVLGFATWWTCFSLFASTALGLIYQTYFTHT